MIVGKNRGTEFYLTRMLNKELPMQRRDPNCLRRIENLTTLVRQLHALASLAISDADDDAITDATYAVNVTLQQFHACPAFEPGSVTGETGWQISWYKPGERNPMMEVKAALTILDLAAKDELWRIGECDYCHRWMYRRVQRQRFCGNRSCKEDFERSDVAFKEHRAQAAKTARVEKITRELRQGKPAPRRGRPPLSAKRRTSKRAH